MNKHQTLILQVEGNEICWEVWKCAKNMNKFVYEKKTHPKAKL